MPGGCYSSWGQCLAYFIGESTAIDNQAHSGLTTETFRNEGHYDIVKKNIRPGDFCLFQFGHNDQKLAHLQAQTGYKENLMNYVNEIRGLLSLIHIYQWSNMLGGTELIRRKLGEDAGAMTITLLLNSEGKKMGKTVSGAVWLDPEKTSPYDFYQYWRNVADADVLKCIRMPTFLPLEQIDEMDKWEGSQLNKAKEILAFELTKLVHGEEEAKKAESAAKALFGAGNAAEIPAVELSAADFAEGEGEKLDILSLLVKAGLAKSRSEARRAVEQGGVSVNDEKVTDIRMSFAANEIPAEGLVIKKGKKNFKKIVVA